MVLLMEVERTVSSNGKLATAVRSQPHGHVSEPLPTKGNRTSEVVRVRYRIALGRFDDTVFTGMETIHSGNFSSTLYANRQGGTSIAINKPLKPYGKLRVVDMQTVDGRLEIRGELYTRHESIQSATLLLKGRTTGVRASSPMRLYFNESETRANFGLHHYSANTSLEIDQVLENAALGDDTLDAWLDVIPSRNEPSFQIRVGSTTLLAKLRSKTGWAQRGDVVGSLTPYYTYKAHKTSFHLEIFDAGVYRELRSRMNRPRIATLFRSKSNIWLIGERPYKAQDNGLHFFRYLRQHHPEIDAYYVIERHSPELRNLEGLGNVVFFKSKQHIELAFAASRFVGTHHPDFLFPTRMPRFRRSLKGIHVFLQHGVMGTKWLAPMYGKTVSSFHTDLFTVSSEREKEIIVRDFGYQPNEVVVTGLARFDRLLAGDVDVKKHQLLIIPTWREWLQDPEHFLESEYYIEWLGFLRSPELKRLVHDNQLEVVFCLHPNMQQHRQAFADVEARVVVQGEIDVQFLLKESGLMVTDYSSVAFDFSFLHKPVFYFQFDRDRFLGPNGSHLDLDRELPGKILGSVDLLVGALDDCIRGGTVMDDEDVAKATNFLDYRDDQSCRRIYEAVLGAQTNRRWRDQLQKSSVYSLIYSSWRRHRFYFPSIRFLLKLARILPLDPNRIVFESGVGKQYADSPRYIYEELVRRGDSRKKIWAYSGQLPERDENTTTVRRLSPEYFWHLARAKYWVNNQSYPFYVTRRQHGVYLQTWHGTPLKKMGHDLEVVHGRDEGYLGRIARAAAQWSVVASPNKYTSIALRSSFRYEGEILELGYPRNDVLSSVRGDEIRVETRAALGIAPGQRVFLYAPTFRDSENVGGSSFAFELPIDLRRFHREFGAEAVLLIRAHVLIRDSLEIPAEVQNVVKDVSEFPEIEALYLASDALVTDYSSVFFDYLITGKPVLFYAYDLVEYRDVLRGFYLPYDDSLPGPILTSQEDLFAALSSIEAVSGQFKERYEDFRQRFCANDDGRAAARIVDSVFPKTSKDSASGE
jgi:Putative glycosyl/glycerophosphate transferases involved in teichoic acid biosynthesis TagF/TagB/EpsJ/RodC